MIQFKTNEKVDSNQDRIKHSLCLGVKALHISLVGKRNFFCCNRSNNSYCSEINCHTLCHAAQILLEIELQIWWENKLFIHCTA